MAIENWTKIYSGADRSGATAGVIYLPLLQNGELQTIDVLTKTAQTGAAVFELKINNVAVGGAITIADGAKIGSVAGLTIPVVKGDEAVLSLVSGNVAAPITLNLAIDDGEEGGGAALPSGDVDAATNTVEKIQDYEISLPAKTSVADNFNDGVINPQWVISGAATETGGVLNLPNGASIRLASNYNLVGKFVSYKSGLNGGTSCLITDSVSGLTILLRDLISGNGFLRTEKHYSNTAETYISPAEKSDNQYFKLAFDGGDFILSTSPTGLAGTWTVRQTRSITAGMSLLSCTVEFFNQSGAATVDDFNSSLEPQALADKTLFGWWNAATSRFEKATLAELKAAITDVPVVLTDAATITSDAAQGSMFSVTLGGNRTLANPTNLRDGTVYVFEFIQDAVGGREISLDNLFAFGADITEVVLSTAAHKRDYLTAIYRNSKLMVTGFVRGY